MFSSLKQALEERLREYGFWQEVLGSRVCRFWQEEAEKVLGKEILKKVRPFRFKAGILEVRVNSPVLSQELRLQEQALKEKVNARLKEPALRRVLYRIESFV